MAPPILPLRTSRVVIRLLDRTDITTLTRYRNDPEVARYQEWPLPYTRDLAHALLDEIEGLSGPTPGRWIQLAVDGPDGMVGDLAVWLDDEAELAVIGYTIDPAHQRRGYATEAVGALVDALFTRVGIHRVAATLDPANIASARVLQRNGFRYEGRSVAAAKVRGLWSDDDRYALLADDLRAWRERSVTPPATRDD